MKETLPGFDHGYVNDAVHCSSIDITVPETPPHGHLRGSNEFILTSDGRKVLKTNSYERIEQWLSKKKQSAFSKKMLYKRLPILSWLPQYNSTDFVGDLVAGITVGLTVIPQALAYSSIAGLPAAYGLYGSFLGCLVYIFLGTCKDVPMGPTAIAALLTYQVAKGDVLKAALLAFLTGLIQVLMGFMKLGFLIDFVSGPVSSGFTSAVSLIIVTSQVKDVLGVEAKGSTFVQIWSGIFKNIDKTSLWDTCLGIGCIVILLLMRLIAMIKIGPKEEELKTTRQKVINKILWLIGTSRNAILVVICGIMGYYFQHNSAEKKTPFQIIGDIPEGLPTFQIPKFTLSANESSTGTEESFLQLVNGFGSGLIILPLITLMENIAICKAFSNGKPVDASQELIAVGTANIVNSFAQGFPGTGSLSRSAVNNASGVRTPMGNIFTSAIVLLSLMFFTPYFSYIPKATLAGIIIAAVVFMVEIRVVAPMWRTKKSDLVPGLGTFICCLALPLEIGIVVGIGLNMAFILYHAARPKISCEVLKTHNNIEYLMITPDRAFIFPSADYVRNLVMKQSMKQNLPVVIDATHIYGADYTAANVILSLTQDFSKRKQPLFFYNLKSSVCSVFEGLSPVDFVVFYREENLDELLATRDYKPPQPQITA
ncbi:sodium-independent sulfate anion transporter [Culicoides brevitarsis]|uniref:sodium-independent sulfate anion transporter n=1 Tax=Culicoides brevitarsis TaxID=469753 RepID=UPI00307C555D